MLHASTAVLEHGVWDWGLETLPRVWGLGREQTFSKPEVFLQDWSQNCNCHRGGKQGCFYFTCTSALESPVQADLILLGFAFRSSQILCFFHKLKVYGNPVSSKCIGAIFPTAFVLSMSLCHIWVILEAVQTFPLLLNLLWWAVISDLWCYYRRQITTHWRLRRQHF